MTVDGRPLRAEAPVRHVYLAVHKPAGVASTVRDRHARPDRRGPGPARARPRRPPVPGGSPGPGLRGPHPAHQRRRLGRARPPPAVRGGARVRGRPRAAAHPRPGGGARARRRAGRGRRDRSARSCGARPTPRTAGSRTSWSPSRTRGSTWVRVTIHQGWKRQLRRMFGEVGAPVRRLVRVRIGDAAPGHDDDRRRAAARRRRGPPPGAAGRAAERAGRYPRSHAATPPTAGSSSRSTGPPRAARAPWAPPPRRGWACGSWTPGLIYRAHDRAWRSARAWPSTTRRRSSRSRTGSSLGDDGTGRLTRVLLDGDDASEADPQPTRSMARCPRSRGSPRCVPPCSSASGRSRPAAGSWSRAATSARSCCPTPGSRSSSTRRSRSGRTAGSPSAGWTRRATRPTLVRDQLRARDAQDRNRAVAPLPRRGRCRCTSTPTATRSSARVDLVVAAIGAAEQGSAS